MTPSQLVTSVFWVCLFTSTINIWCQLVLRPQEIPKLHMDAQLASEMVVLLGRELKLVRKKVEDLERELLEEVRYVLMLIYRDFLWSFICQISNPLAKWKRNVQMQPSMLWRPWTSMWRNLAKRILNCEMSWTGCGVWRRLEFRKLPVLTRNHNFWRSLRIGRETRYRSCGLT